MKFFIFINFIIIFCFATNATWTTVLINTGLSLSNHALWAVDGKLYTFGGIIELDKPTLIALNPNTFQFNGTRMYYNNIDLI